MSTTSPQAEAAGQQSLWQAQLAQQLSGISQPELIALLGGKRWVTDLPPGGATPGSGAKDGAQTPSDAAGGGLPYTPGRGPGHWEDVQGSIPGLLGSVDASGRMAPDAAILKDATGQLNAGYGQAQMGTREAINYGGLRSGESRLSSGAMNSALGSAATGLERDRQAALRNLNFASAQSSMSDYNKVLQLLGQGTQTSLGLAQGFSGASGAAIGGLSNQTQAGGIIGGAATGASLGSYGGIYGAAIGAVAGGLYGGLSSP